MKSFIICGLLYMLVGIGFMVQSVSAQANNANSGTDSIDVVVLTYETLQDEEMLDSSTISYRPKPRTDTTMTIVADERFLTEVCDRNGCYTYMFNSATNTMSVFDWKGVYSDLLMDSVAFYDDSLQKLQIDKKIDYILAAKRRFSTAGFGVLALLLTGWERDVILDTLKEIPLSKEEKRKLAAAKKRAQADTSGASEPKKRRGRVKPASTKESKEDEIDPMALLSPEERERVNRTIWLRYALSRDGGIGTKVIVTEAIGRHTLVIDSLLSSDTLLGMATDHYDFNWTSELYSLRGYADIIPRERSRYDLTPQGKFDDNLSIFARLDRSDRTSVLFPMGRRIWNDRGLVVRLVTTIETDDAKFRIARNLIKAESMRVPVSAFAVPKNYDREDWIRHEVGEIVKSINGSYFEAYRTRAPRPKEEK